MDYDRLIALRMQGLRSEGLGPEAEWSPVAEGEFQRRHAQFWAIIAEMICKEDGDYDDLPEWMTETAAQELELND